MSHHVMMSYHKRGEYLSMDSESYIQQLSRETINKIFEFYAGMISDNMVLRENLMIFVNEFIQIVIAQALADYNYKMPKKEQMKEVFNNFSVLKEQCEQNVANSFSMAMRRYAGQNIDYYCLIKRVTEPMNTIPC
jgi:lantibiotic modifying enzyme